MSPGLRGLRRRCEAKASRDDGDALDQGTAGAPAPHRRVEPHLAGPLGPRSPSPALGERAQVRPHLCLVRAVVCERAGAKTPTIADYRGDDRLTRDSYRFPRFLAWGVSLLVRPGLLERSWWRACGWRVARYHCYVFLFTSTTSSRSTAMLVSKKQPCVI